MEFFRYLMASLFYISGISFLRAKILQKKEPLVRPLLIHHIKSPRKYEKMISYISRRYNSISLDDLSNNNLDPQKINVLLTMDDGYESWITTGLPILEQYNVPAVFFISSGFINSAQTKEGPESFNKKNLMLGWTSNPLSAEQLQTLSEHPLITLGGHTINHPFLTALAIDEQRQEILADKETTEQITNSTLPVFAYPFGDYNVDSTDIVQKAGYHYAMTTKTDFYKKDIYSTLEIPRSNHGTVAPFLLPLWVIGSFDLVYLFENAIRRKLKKVLSIFKK